MTLSLSNVAHAPPSESRRWLALVFIALGQLMVALDATIVNVALPSVQQSLGFADVERHWVVTAYLLPFAGTLLLGGRIADSFGQKRALLVGLAGFAMASLLGGTATSLSTLMAARALQGLFGALLSPTALSLVAVSFPDPRARAKAFGVYGAVAACGASLGLVLGGWLMRVADWRFCLYVNVVFAAVALVGASLTLVAPRRTERPKLDLLGALLVGLGVTAVVLGCTSAYAEGWGSPAVLSRIGLGAALLGLFLLRQKHTSSPLLPLAILFDRNRALASLVAALAVAAMFGLFLLLTYHFQVVSRHSPLETGLAFLPMSLAAMFGSSVLARWLGSFLAPRVLIPAALAVAALGMLLIARVDVHSAYFTHIAPAEILVGLGIGSTMMPAFSLATSGVDPRDAGIASAMIATAQQIGGSIGTAFLNTMAASASAAYLSEHAGAVSEALVHGSRAAAGWGAFILVLAASCARGLTNPVASRSNS